MSTITITTSILTCRWWANSSPMTSTWIRWWKPSKYLTRFSSSSHHPCHPCHCHHYHRHHHHHHPHPHHPHPHHPHHHHHHHDDGVGRRRLPDSGGVEEDHDTARGENANKVFVLVILFILFIVIVDNIQTSFVKILISKNRLIRIFPTIIILGACNCESFMFPAKKFSPFFSNFSHEAKSPNQCWMWKLYSGIISGRVVWENVIFLQNPHFLVWN